MAEQVEPKEVSMSTQAFLILCRLFDSCYDEMARQENIRQVVEETAHVLLAGVSVLHEQSTPPKTIVLALPFQQAYFLRKLVQLHYPVALEAKQEKTRRWLDECLEALQQASL